MDKPAGKVDRRKDGKEYWALNVNGKHLMAHRMAWLYVHGTIPKNQIDHIDGNGLNNCIDNLRDVTAAENSMNKRKYANNTSGINGVSWDRKKGRWEVKVTVNFKNKRIGRFNNLLDAACARMNANTIYGCHGNHGKDKFI